MQSWGLGLDLFWKFLWQNKNKINKKILNCKHYYIKNQEITLHDNGLSLNDWMISECVGSCIYFQLMIIYAIMFI